MHKTETLNLSATIITRRGYPALTYEDGHVIINDLPYPYEFQLEVLPAFQINSNGENYSFTRAVITLERKSIGYIMGGYYYPTTAFALLSMISYLIHPDVVRFFIKKRTIIPWVHTSKSQSYQTP